MSGTVLDVRDVVGSKVDILHNVRDANCRVDIQKQDFIFQSQ